MDILLKEISTKEGEEILSNYKRLEETNKDYLWEYVTFEVVRGMTLKYEIAINKEFKVYRFLTKGEAFNAGVKMD